MDRRDYGRYPGEQRSHSWTAAPDPYEAALSPEPTDVRLDLENYHTVGLSSSERQDYWNVFHSNRLHYAKTRAERADASIEEKRIYERMAEAMEALERKIIGNEQVFDGKSVPIVVAVN